MAKQRKEKPPQKTCIFCGGLPLSKEHFWPEWSAPYMPQSENHTLGKTRGWVGAPNEEVLKDWSRQGHVGVITIRIVCDPCNNGWMNREEERVRPFLEPMLKGESLFLSTEMQLALATYITMKVMVADQYSPEISGFAPVEYEAFYRDRTIPVDLSIRLFMFTSPFFRVTMYNREYAADKSKSGWERTQIANFTYRFGALFVQALFRRNEGLMKIGNSPIAIELNPPLGRPRQWPPMHQIDERIAYDLQHWTQTIAEGGYR